MVAPELIQPFAAAMLKLLTFGAEVTSSINVFEVLVHPLALVTVILPV